MTWFKRWRADGNRIENSSGQILFFYIENFRFCTRNYSQREILMRNYRGEENCENVDWRNELRWRSSSTRSRICLYFTLNFLKLWRSFYRLLDRSVNPLETYELIAYRRPAILPDNGCNFCDKMDHKPIHMSFVRERIHKQLTWKRPCDPWPQSSQMLLLWHQSSIKEII